MLRGGESIAMSVKSTKSGYHQYINFNGGITRAHVNQFTDKFVNWFFAPLCNSKAFSWLSIHSLQQNELLP